MPNRILKESICYSDDIDKLTPFEETVFYRLMVRVDDYGRIDARRSFLKSMLFATKQGVTEKNIEDAVRKLASVGLVKLYEVDKKPFLLFPKWNVHQSIRAKKSKYPKPNENLQADEINCKHMQADECICSRNPNPNTNTNPKEKEIYKEKEISGDISSKKNFIPPMVEEVREYCAMRKNTVKAEDFVDFYTAKGWYIGKNKMKDWKAAVRLWENKNRKEEKKGDADICMRTDPKYGTVL